MDTATAAMMHRHKATAPRRRHSLNEHSNWSSHSLSRNLRGNTTMGLPRSQQRAFPSRPRTLLQLQNFRTSHLVLPFLLLLLSLHAPHVPALDPSASSAQSSFGAAGHGLGVSGYVEVEPTFFKKEGNSKEGNPKATPEGAPDHWPLDYEQFQERKVVTTLVAWLRANGVTALGEASSPINIEIDYNTTLRASGLSRGNLRIVARRNISAGEAFMSVPMKIVMGPDLAKADSPSNIREGAFPAAVLAAWLLREKAKGAASAWHGYLQALPQHLPVPFLVPESVMAVAEYPYLANMTKHLEGELQKQFALLGPEAVAFANFTEFVLAFSTVTSRMLTVPRKAKVPRTAQKINSALAAAAAAATVTGTVTVSGQNGASTSQGGGGSSGWAKGREASWEDEFLLDEDEAAALERQAQEKGKGVGKSDKRSAEAEEEEDEPVPVLAPLVDFFDWDEEPTAVMEVTEDTLVFRATRAIGKGQPIFLQLPEAQNENHLIERGFVPEFNGHDGAIVFKNRMDAIWYFREQFLAGKFNDNYLAVMEDTFDLAAEFTDLEAQKPKYRSRYRAHIEYYVPYERNAPSFAWWGARLDAVHLAGIAAGQSITLSNKTPDYRLLAPAALTYAWILQEGVSCDSLANFVTDRESDSFHCAATTVLLKVEDLLRAFNATVQQDQHALRIFKLCKELSVFGRTSTGEDFEMNHMKLLEDVCPEVVLDNLAEMDHLVRLKMSKRTVYKQIQDRIAKTCEMP